MKDLDKYRGCLIGGAAGDALGYAVEFLDVVSIFQKYGENGITEYDLIKRFIFPVYHFLCPSNLIYRLQA